MSVSLQNYRQPTNYALKTTYVPLQPAPTPTTTPKPSTSGKTSSPPAAPLTSGEGAVMRPLIWKAPPGVTLEDLLRPGSSGAAGKPGPQLSPDDPLAKYVAAPLANESSVPPLLAQGGFTYGSKPLGQAPVNTSNIDKPYIIGALPTGPQAGELAKGGAANIFNPAWQQQVAQAVEMNGGLGNSQEGFLAFSPEYGFVRLRNPNLTPEQNRRFAEISLTMGSPVEKLPSRSKESSMEKTNVDDWANKFIASYDTKLATFLNDPTQGIQLKDGRLRFKMEFNQEAGGVVSYNYKKAGRFQSFVQGAMKYISPLADIASVAFPGVGTAIAQAVKFAGNAIARGKIMASDIAGAVAGFIPGIGKGLGLALTGTQVAATNAILGAGANVIDGKGKLGWGALASAVGSSLIDTGNLNLDKLAKGGLGALGDAIDGKKFSAGDLLQLLQPLGKVVGQEFGVLDKVTGAAANATDAAAKGNGLPDWGNDILGSIGIKLDAGDVKLIGGLGKAAFNGIRNGEFSAKDIASVLQQTITPALTDDAESQVKINYLLASLGQSVDAGQTSPAALLQAIASGLKTGYDQVALAQSARETDLRQVA